MFQEAWDKSKHFIYGSLYGLALTGIISESQSFLRTVLLLGVVDLAIFLSQLFLVSRKN